MNFIVAFLLSGLVCIEIVLVGAVQGNIVHLRNGRVPNAGVSLLPMIPLFQLLSLALAWILESLIPNFALAVLLGLFTLQLVFWILSFKKAKRDLKQLQMDGPITPKNCSICLGCDT